MKTSRNYLYVAALLLAATFTACSSDGDIASENVTPQPDQPATGKEVILTGTLADKGGEETRSVDRNGKTKWEDGEEIAIYYQKTDGTFATATATIKRDDIDYSDGYHTTSYTAQLTDPKSGTNVKLVYPATMHDGHGGYKTESLMSYQNGDIWALSMLYDIATGAGYMTVNGSKATLPTVTMKNEVCICAFTFDGVPAEDWNYNDSWNTPVINDGTNEYTIRFGSDIDSPKTMYVAMLPTAGSTFTFSVRGDKQTPFTNSLGQREARENTYHLLNVDKDNLTTDHVGCVFDKDLNVYSYNPLRETLRFKKTVNNVTLEAGKFYKVHLTLTSEAETNPEITPVAVITYVGSQTGHAFSNSSYNFLPIKDANVGSHGLAMALFDADGNAYNPNTGEAVTTYQWKTSTGYQDNGDFQITTEADFGKQYDDDDKPTQPYTDGYLYTYVHCKLQTADNYPAFKAAYNYANICGFDPYTKGATPWYLPSAFQWQQMVDACNSYMPTNTISMSSSTPKIYYAAQFGRGSAFSTNQYWSSTEYNADHAWSWWYTGGTGGTNGNPSWNHNSKTAKRAVRAIFGF